MGLFGTGTANGSGLLDKAGGAVGSLFDSLRKEEGEFSYIEDEVGIPRGTLYPLMMAESEQWALQGKPTIESKAGALGQFQLLPKTARQYTVKNELSGDGSVRSIKTNPFDLHEAARAAANEIKMGLKKTGSLDKALAIYNYGYGKSRKQNFDLDKIDKIQTLKETRKHRERFHKYHGGPEKNIDWMQPLMNKQKEQYAAEQPLKKWMYPPPKQGVPDKRLMYPEPKRRSLQEVTATAQAQPVLQPFNRIVEHYPPVQQPSRIVEHQAPQQKQLSALEQLKQFERMYGN